MRGVCFAFIVVTFLLSVYVNSVVGQGPLFKVFAQPSPIFRGRVDPIVEPGVFAQHSHKVFGGNHFTQGSTAISNQAYGDFIRNASCTTSSITIDNSNYWIPDLYYKWDNGSLSLIPVGGLTVYYLSRPGSTGTQQSNPNWQPFPRGFRMTAGSPFRRSFNGSISEQGILYACLPNGPAVPETNGFPTKTFCANGLRAQVFFPMCWDGVNLDSPTHQSHVHYPINNYNGGDCPSTHPVRLPGVFFEVLFSVSSFPHGDGVNRFVWSSGDTTGYSLHGDFLNGWDVDILGRALKDPSCYASNTNNGNTVTNCNTLKQYVKANNPDKSCQLATPIYDTEDLGYAHLIDHLPGCNPIYGGPSNAVPCFGQWAVTLPKNVRRVFVQNAGTGHYWFSPVADVVNVTAKPAKFWRAYIYVMTTDPSTGLTTIQSEGAEQFVTGPLYGLQIAANRGSASAWEYFKLEIVSQTSNVTTVRIRANSNNQYLAEAAGITGSTGSSVNNMFNLIDANAGVADTRTSKTGYFGPNAGKVGFENSGSAAENSGTPAENSGTPADTNAPVKNADSAAEYSSSAAETPTTPKDGGQTTKGNQTDSVVSSSASKNNNNKSNGIPTGGVVAIVVVALVAAAAIGAVAFYRVKGHIFGWSAGSHAPQGGYVAYNNNA